MKFATLGPRGAVLAVQDTQPTLPDDTLMSVAELSDEQAITVQTGKQSTPPQIYFFEDGELITIQQRMQARQSEMQAEMESKHAAAQKAKLDAMPLSKKIEMGESHVERQGFGASRLVTCMDLLLQAKEAGTIADKPKLVAVYQWLQTVKGTALAGSIAFAPAPFSFEEVLSEA